MKDHQGIIKIRWAKITLFVFHKLKMLFAKNGLRFFISNFKAHLTNLSYANADVQREA